MKNILLIEDDVRIADILMFYLSHDGDYHVEWVTTGREALQHTQNPTDIILLDIRLPDIDGVTLCKRIREALYCPIIYISCLDDEDTIIRALEAGGDDYLTKPFSAKILRSRIEANLRRVEIERHAHGSVRFAYPDFTIDPNEHAILRSGQLYRLPPIEYSILMYFITHPKRTISLDELYESIWGKPCFGDTRTVVTHVYNIRRILKSNSASRSYIQSIRGYGYYFSPDGL